MNEFSINLPDGGKQLFNAFEAEEKRITEQLRSEFAEPEESAQVVQYPLEIFAGTLPGEFAERCTKGNNIAPELFIEAFLTVLGAVVGNQLQGDRKGMNARQYMIAVAPPQHGKDVANDEAQEVFRAEQEEFDAEGAPFGA